MLLDHLGEHDAASAVLHAIERSISDGVVTKDMGGQAKTSDVGDYLSRIILSG
jgi:3-isopropylmalate dehydrogenase